ncbi:MAG TPA: CGNR zinc finger domain-containing protein [Gemmatimonadales bacterium]|nr:CGNR zinc finger domain-containing protein [Gemmatimonadales bacterium]
MTLTPQPHLPFRYDGGNLAVDLVNTVDWAEAGPKSERLLDYAGLLEWAEGAELIGPASGRALRSLATAHPALAARVYRETVVLRGKIQQLFLHYIRDEDPPAELLGEFNGLVRRSLEHRTLRNINRGDNSGCLRWQWDGMGEDLYSLWWPVVNAAADLLTSSEAARLRVCAAADCGWMFIDRSRNGMRRWCAMDGSCGGREKARRHYARVRARK